MFQRTYECKATGFGLRSNAKKMNGRLSKVDMTNKLFQLKRELDYKCEIGEMGEWECNGAKKYMNKAMDTLDEYWA